MPLPCPATPLHGRLKCHSRADYKAYVCDLGDTEPIMVLIEGKEKDKNEPTRGPAVAKKMASRKVMIISKKVR